MPRPGRPSLPDPPPAAPRRPRRPSALDSRADHPAAKKRTQRPRLSPLGSAPIPALVLATERSHRPPPLDRRPDRRNEPTATPQTLILPSLEPIAPGAPRRTEPAPPGAPRRTRTAHRAPFGTFPRSARPCAPIATERTQARRATLGRTTSCGSPPQRTEPRRPPSARPVPRSTDRRLPATERTYMPIRHPRQRTTERTHLPEWQRPGRPVAEPGRREPPAPQEVPDGHRR